MKNGIKGYIAGILTCVILFGIVFASYGQVREIFFGVQVRVNGELQNFAEDMTPFITEERTFLPVRGIADALGLDVDFDEETNTVLLNNNIIDDLLGLSDEAVAALVADLFEILNTIELDDDEQAIADLLYDVFLNIIE